MANRPSLVVDRNQTDDSRGLFFGAQGRTSFSGFRRTSAHFRCIVERKHLDAIYTSTFLEVVDRTGRYVSLVEICSATLTGTTEVELEGRILSSAPYAREGEQAGYVLGLEKGFVRFIAVDGIVNHPCTGRAMLAIALDFEPLRPWVLCILEGRVVAARRDEEAKG